MEKVEEINKDEFKKISPEEIIKFVEENKKTTILWQR